MTICYGNRTDQRSAAGGTSRPGIEQPDWGGDGDLERAHELTTRYGSLRLGLVDGVVMAIAERLKADAVATLDLRHFGAVELAGKPRLLPRDA